MPGEREAARQRQRVRHRDRVKKRNGQTSQRIRQTETGRDRAVTHMKEEKVIN